MPKTPVFGRASAREREPPRIAGASRRSLASPVPIFAPGDLSPQRSVRERHWTEDGRTGTPSPPFYRERHGSSPLASSFRQRFFDFTHLLLHRRTRSTRGSTTSEGEPSTVSLSPRPSSACAVVVPHSKSALSGVRSYSPVRTHLGLSNSRPLSVALSPSSSSYTPSLHLAMTPDSTDCTFSDLALRAKAQPRASQPSLKQAIVSRFRQFKDSRRHHSHHHMYSDPRPQSPLAHRPSCKFSLSPFYMKPIMLW